MTTKTRTTTAATVHGEVEYETVDCSSCQTEVRKDNAFGFVIYDTDCAKRDFHDGLHHHEWKIHDRGYATGYACEYCYENGPIEYPTTTITRKISSELPISPSGLLFALIPIAGIYYGLDIMVNSDEGRRVTSGGIGLIAQLVAIGIIGGLLV